MTGSTFVWDDRYAQALFQRLAAAGKDTGSLLGKLAFSLTERVRLAFHDQADPWGSPWAPLSARTLLRRRDGGRAGASILRDTGQLLASLTSAMTQGAADIRIGFADRPATIHQFGGKAGRGRKVTIPARPMMPIRESGEVDLPPTWRDEIVSAMTAHVEAVTA